MTNSRTVLHIPFSELSGTDTIFTKYSGVDINNIPSRYGDKVLHTKELIVNNLSLSIVYQRVSITNTDTNHVILNDYEHNTFTGDLLPLVLKDSREIICCIVTLTGYTPLAESISNKLLGYFIDTWGSAFVEAGMSYFKALIDHQLETTPLKRTYLWSPGFAQFDLENQKPIFNLLKPNDIDCHLDTYCRMLPTKSASGIIGLVPKETNTTLKPCTFCDFNEKCSALQISQCL